MRQYTLHQNMRNHNIGGQAWLCGNGGNFARGKQAGTATIQQRQTAAATASDSFSSNGSAVDLQCMDKIDEETLRLLIVELELNKPRVLPELRVIASSQEILVSVQGPER